MIVITLLAALIAGYGILEYYRHQRRVTRVPIRIHVNGSRGKSSVTRLIAAGLRAGGIRTYGKTTGTSPRVIDPSGLEIPIHRLRSASIGEQVKIFPYFIRKQAEAVVIECMAIQPKYQWLSEQQMIHATIGVMTNVRPDHTREMGPGLVQITKSLCNSMPIDGVLYTSEEKMVPEMQPVAEEYGTDLIVSSQAEVSSDEMKGFTYVEHKSNVSLALKVCEACGVDRTAALAGMHKAHPDPGAMKLVNVAIGKKQFTFVNGFAANDPDSTLQIWHRIYPIIQKADSVLIILNSRIDRFPRTIQLVDLVARVMEYERLLIVGGRTGKAVRHAQHKGIAKERIIDLGEAGAEDVFKQCVELGVESTVIFGIGNMGGGGGEIVEYFKYHTEPHGEMIV